MKNSSSIKLAPHATCTGCEACLNACPVDAISMNPLESNDGAFLYPTINPNQCIGCGLCERSCPILNPIYSNDSNPECYAMWAQDDVREISSSGGAFTVLAEYILEKDGVVFGAAYSDDCYGVKYKAASSPHELAALRGSKYVQSAVGHSMREAKAVLEQKRPVLFVGCPCQIAGLQAFLGYKDNPNLYTVDLVCHGVPPQALLEQFVKEEELKVGSKAIRISFRDKSFVPWNISTSIDFANGETYRKKRNECAYLKAFIDRIMFRESCGRCPFATIPRQGDVTLADFWDIHRHDPSLDDRKGTSLILTNNDKGRELLKAIEPNCKVCTAAPLEHAIRYNAQIKYSSLHNEKRERFFNLLQKYHYTFEKAALYALENKYDIGYIGWWYGANYGSALTAFALNRVLVSMGKTVLMPHWPMNPPSEAITNSILVENFYDCPPYLPLEEQDKLNQFCDTFVVGSDQLWNWWSNRDVGTYYFFLDWVDDSHKKIAYSTSFGHDNVHYPKDMRLRIGYLLSRFDAISVRERSGTVVCERDFDVNAVQTIDPVFLCDTAEYETLAGFSALEKPNEPYLLAYILNPTPDKAQSIRHIANALNLQYRIIVDGQGEFEALSNEIEDKNIVQNVTLEDWLLYFRHASYVVTDSFHGTCFSIIFKKSMTIFPNTLRGKARFDTLDELAGIGNRYVYSYDELIESKMWEQIIDYSAVASRMRPSIEFSKSWLSDKLNAAKLPPSVNTLQYEHLRDLSEATHRLETAVSNLENQQGRYRRLLKLGFKSLKENGVVDTAKRVARKIATKMKH